MSLLSTNMSGGGTLLGLLFGLEQKKISRFTINIFSSIKNCKIICSRAQQIKINLVL
jgi:hypothetical protein